MIWKLGFNIGYEDEFLPLQVEVEILCKKTIHNGNEEKNAQVKF